MRGILFCILIYWHPIKKKCFSKHFNGVFSHNISLNKMHRSRKGAPGFFRKIWNHTQRGAHQVDGFFRKHGRQIREIAMAVAPAIAPTQPGIAAGVATFGQGAASYSSLRDALDRAAA